MRTSTDTNKQEADDFEHCSRLLVLGIADALGAYCKGGIALRKRWRAYNLAGPIFTAPCNQARCVRCLPAKSR